MIEVLKQALEALEQWNTPLYKRGTVIETLRQAIAELESQEPVPTIEDLEQEIYQNTRNFVSLDVMEWMLKRYYTHPPQRSWVGLTDEEIESALPGYRAIDALDIYHAIEKALQEKNT